MHNAGAETRVFLSVQAIVSGALHRVPDSLLAFMLTCIVGICPLSSVCVESKFIGTLS